jgi:hypothetical protein
VEIAQVAAIAMSAEMRVDDLARVPLPFPTYTGNLAYAAAAAARQLDLDVGWQASEIEGDHLGQVPHHRAATAMRPWISAAAARRPGSDGLP